MRSTFSSSPARETDRVTAPEWEVDVNVAPPGWEPHVMPFLLVPLSRCEAAQLAYRLDRSALRRLVLRAYPGFCDELRQRARDEGHTDLHRLLRRIEGQGTGLVDDLAREALRASGVEAEVKGLREVQGARQRLSEIEAQGSPITTRGELTRTAYPVVHPGLVVPSATALRRACSAVPRLLPRRQRGRAARPGRACRRQRSRAPNDPDEPGPGEAARRAADDDVAVGRLLPGAVA